MAKTRNIGVSVTVCQEFLWDIEVLDPNISNEQLCSMIETGRVIIDRKKKIDCEVIFELTANRSRGRILAYLHNRTADSPDTFYQNVKTVTEEKP